MVPGLGSWRARDPAGMTAGDRVETMIETERRHSGKSSENVRERGTGRVYCASKGTSGPDARLAIQLTNGSPPVSGPALAIDGSMQRSERGGRSVEEAGWGAGGDADDFFVTGGRNFLDYRGEYSSATVTRTCVLGIERGTWSWPFGLERPEGFQTSRFTSTNSTGTTMPAREKRVVAGRS